MPPEGRHISGVAGGQFGKGPGTGLGGRQSRVCLLGKGTVAGGLSDGPQARSAGRQDQHEPHEVVPPAHANATRLAAVAAVTCVNSKSRWSP